jgi:hypothetical protein
MTVLVDLIDARREIRVDFRLERRRDHPTRPLTRQLIKRDRGLFIALPDKEPANI